MTNESELSAAISAAQPGDTILFAANITLTADLPWVISDVTIDGGGFTLSGAGQHRGLVIGDISGFSSAPSVSVTIQDLTIADTLGLGGAGQGSTLGGGGGGGGIGGAILVGDLATTTVSGVTIVNSSAVGGNGAGITSDPIPGAGGTGIGALGQGGDGNQIPGDGSYGGGGGGGLGFGGTGGFAAGDGTGAGSGGGGAALGGAIFVQGGGVLSIVGGLTINGSSVTAGLGAAGAQAGQAFGAGIFLDGSGILTIAPPAGATVTILDSIADQTGAVGGPGRWILSKDGAGTLVLGGANLYSGDTEVLDGTLRVFSDANLGLASTLGGGDVRLSDGATLELAGNGAFARSLFLEGAATLRVDAGVTSLWNGSILDSDITASLFVTGGGTVTLGNTNGFSGGLTVAGNSTVQFGDDGALGEVDAAVQVGDLVSGGTLRLTSGSTVSTRDFLLAGTGPAIFDVAGASQWSIDGQISGSGSLTKAGAGALVLSGANPYAGGTSVLAGTLRAGAADVFGTGTMNVQTGATLDLSGFDQTVGSLAGGGSVTLGAAALAAGTDDSSTTFSGAISGTGSFTKLGAGTLTLTGANTYTGGTAVVQGTLVGTTASLQGNISNAGAVVFDQAFAGTYSGILSGTGTLTKSGGGTVTLAGANTYTGLTTISGGILVVNTGTLPGNVVNNATIQFDQAAAGTFGGLISGAGSFVKSGAGTLGLSGAQAFTGATAIQGGTLLAGTSNVLAASSGVTIASGATFDLNGFDQTIGSLAGGGNVALGSATLTTGGSDSTTLSGVISGTGQLQKTGAGSLTLLGANTYSGGTTVSGGILRGNTTSLQGAILNNSQVAFDQNFAGTYAGSMTGAGSLIKTGAGAVTLTGVNTYSGGTTIAGGTLIGTPSNIRGPVTNNGLIVFNQPGDGSFSGSIVGTGGLEKLGSGTLTLGGPSAYTGATTISQGVLRAGAAGAVSSTSPIAIAGGATLDLDGFDHTLISLSGAGHLDLGGAELTTGANGVSATFAGTIGGDGSLVKAGSGVLTLTGQNTYAGGTTVLGGILRGTTRSLQGDILNDARVVFDQGFNGTYAGSMSGSGILEKAGAGTLTLTGTNTYGGGTVITEGAIVGTAASLSGAIVNNASLTFGGAADGAFLGTLGGIGNLTKTGASTLTLNGNHPFSGLWTVSQGTLALNGTLGGTLVIDSGATFVGTGAVLGSVNLNGTLRIPAPSSGLASVTPLSPGSLAASAGDRLETPPLLTIGGNVVAGPGSTLDLAIGPGPNPTLFVNGVAALNGTTLDARPIELGTERHLSFLALTAAGGLTVADSTVQTANPLLLPSLRSDGNTLAVSIVNLGVPIEFAVAPEYSSTGAALDRLKGDLTGDRGFVIRELLSLPDDELNDAIRQISGEVHATNRHFEIRSAETFTDLVRSQITDRDHEEEEGRTGWGGPTLRWFGQVSREHVSFDAVGASAGGAADVTDSAGGFELRLSDRWLLGGGGGLGFGSMALDGLAAATDFAAPRAFGVVGFKPSGFGIRGGGSFSRSKAKTNRRILIIARLPEELGGLPLTGGIDREARSEEVSVQSDQWSEYADHVDVGTYRVDYMFGFRRARFSREAFAEAGAGALSLAHDGSVLTLHDTDVKVHWWRRSGGTRPYAEAFFRRSSGFDYTLPIEFAEEEDSDFLASGLPLGQNAFAARVGVTFVRSIGKLTVEYRFRKASGQLSQTADLRFRF